MSFFSRATLISLVFSLILASAGCQKQAAPFVRERFLLDTLVTIKSYEVDGLSKANLRAATGAAFARMRDVEKRLNAHDPESEISELNRQAGGGEFWPSADPGAALQTAAKVEALTGGAFNPAIGPLTRIWRFEGRGRLPAKGEVRRALALSQADRTITDDPDAPVSLGRRGMLVDLGGVAKGVAVDRAVGVLRRRGLKHALVTSTSSTKALGPKPGGRPWLVGVESPRPKQTPGLIGVIELTRGSISTSGDYQQFFIKNGRRYHHILDPKTGYPAKGFMSVTVVTTKSAAFADALSTGLAVMGRKQAMALVKKLPGTDAIFIDGAGRIWVSPGLKKNFRPS